MGYCRKKQAERGVEVGISRGIEERNIKVEFRRFIKNKKKSRGISMGLDFRP